MNKKKITMGVLTGVITIATPIAAVVSCGKEKTHSTSSYLKVHTDRDLGMKTNYELLKEQNNQNINHLMKEVNGKKVFKEAMNLDEEQLKKDKKIMLNITLSDYIKQNFEVEYNKVLKEKTDFIKARFELGGSKEFDAEFLVDLVENKDITKARVLANKLNNLEKAKDFEIVFNVVMPQWLEKEKETEIILDISDRVKRNDFDKIEKITLPKDTKNRLIEVFISSTLTNFDFKSLPNSLESLSLWELHMQSIDPKSIPKNLKWLKLSDAFKKDFLAIDLTIEEKQKRAKFIAWIKKNRPSIKKPNTIFNT
ncbi:MAG: hypothetical protein HRT98_04355 [Mycoplasmatales bacterium]|nr:hypothetical protein [Mycoplasmatales bacterium]